MTHQPDNHTATGPDAACAPFGSAVEGAPPETGPTPAAHEVATRSEIPAQQTEPAQTYVPVAAMEAVMALRHKQIFHFGHTPAADRLLPLKHLPYEALNSARAVVEDIQFNRSRSQMLRHATRSAAMLLAFIDRLLAEEAENDHAPD